jgi:hypothetical protein
MVMLVSLEELRCTDGDNLPMITHFKIEAHVPAKTKFETTLKL